MPANLTNIKDNGVDLSDQYVSVNDIPLTDDSLYLDVNIKYAGKVWAFGYNSTGELGLGDTVHRSSPTQVGSFSDWKYTTTGGGSSFGIRRDGTLWAWGRNTTYGPLGLNNTTSYSSPVQVGALSDWKYIHTSGSNSIAVKMDGTLWAWGNNSDGQLGLGDIVHRSSPIQVGSNGGWKQAHMTGSSTFSVRTDGTLWAWGLNGPQGQLGLNNTTSYSSPVQVGSMSNWAQVAEGIAVKIDGTLWTWGSNNYGQLGLNNTTHRSSPVQVGTLTNWKQVSGTVSKLAVKTDGTLWGWGFNTGSSAYVLGLGTEGQLSSPVQVGSLTNWKSVTTSGSASLAVKTDGTLWAWGYPNNGALGLSNNSTIFSTPVQVGTLTHWKSAITASNVTIATT